MLMGLTFQIIRLRRRNKIPFGDGELEEIARAIRAHANFLEYVPIFLILLSLLEFRGTEELTLFILGAIFFLGRVFHALGISQVNENLKIRVAGMVCTNIGIIGASVRLLGGLF